VYYASSVKMPHIEINIKGNIPQKILSLLIEEYGEKVQLSEDKNEEKVDIVDIFETDWYRKTRAKITPGTI